MDLFATLIFMGFIGFILYMVDKETHLVSRIWNKFISIVKKYSR